MRAAARSLAVLLVLLAAAMAPADYLEVRRAAIVHTDPSADSPAIVRAAPGDHLGLLEGGRQLHGYYLVELASGDEGYVYRSLVRRFPGDLPPPEADEPVPTPAGQDRFTIPP